MTKPTRLPKLKLSPESLIVLVAVFLLTFANHAFWGRMQIGLGSFASAWPIYLAASALLLSLLCLLFALVTPRVAMKPVLTLVLLIAAGAAYFMDHYGAIVDRHALQSVLESDARESAEWLSVGMIWPFTKLAVLPILLLWMFVEVSERSWRSGIFRRLGFITLAAGVAALMIALCYQPFASLARNHTPLRDLFNPMNVINATRAYIKKSSRELPTVIQPVAADVHRGASWQASDRKPMVFVFVVGESVRAQSFALSNANATRDTTPELRQWPVTAFTDVSSCGTNTATSVPCLFSNLTREHYDDYQALSQDNLLDVLMHAGFAVEWIDNNTGSKNVARRATELDVAHRHDPRWCNADGCHDEMLVAELQLRLTALAKAPKDTVLVLHQLGSHGPAYFQRYPETFARFQPTCKSVELQDCSAEAIDNSYDNTVLYTDFVLSRLIQTLSTQHEFETLLFYVSDHGESTGKNGVFLHGAPYAFAPIEQTKVPMLWWFSKAFQNRRHLDAACLDQARQRPTSHDAVFDMTLKMLDLSTSSYRPALNPLDRCG